jgi:isocitrate dehydrogenase
MAEYLGEQDIKKAIFEAADQVINEGKTVTYDLGGNSGTKEMANAIANLAKEKLLK